MHLLLGHDFLRLPADPVAAGLQFLPPGIQRREGFGPATLGRRAISLVVHLHRRIAHLVELIAQGGKPRRQRLQDLAASPLEGGQRRVESFARPPPAGSFSAGVFSSRRKP